MCRCRINRCGDSVLPVSLILSKFFTPYNLCAMDEAGSEVSQLRAALSDARAYIKTLECTNGQGSGRERALTIQNEALLKEAEELRRQLISSKREMANMARSYDEHMHRVSALNGYNFLFQLAGVEARQTSDSVTIRCWRRVQQFVIHNMSLYGMELHPLSAGYFAQESDAGDGAESTTETEVAPDDVAPVDPPKTTNGNVSASEDEVVHTCEVGSNTPMKIVTTIAVQTCEVEPTTQSLACQTEDVHVTIQPVLLSVDNSSGDVSVSSSPISAADPSGVTESAHTRNESMELKNLKNTVAELRRNAKTMRKELKAMRQATVKSQAKQNAAVAAGSPRCDACGEFAGIATDSKDDPGRSDVDGAESVKTASSSVASFNHPLLPGVNVKKQLQTVRDELQKVKAVAEKNSKEGAHLVEQVYAMHRQLKRLFRYNHKLIEVILARLISKGDTALKVPELEHRILSALDSHLQECGALIGDCDEDTKCDDDDYTDVVVDNRMDEDGDLPCEIMKLERQYRSRLEPFMKVASEAAFNTLCFAVFNPHDILGSSRIRNLLLKNINSFKNGMHKEPSASAFEELEAVIQFALDHVRRGEDGHIRQLCLHTLRSLTSDVLAVQHYMFRLRCNGGELSTLYFIGVRFPDDMCADLCVNRETTIKVRVYETIMSTLYAHLFRKLSESSKINYAELSCAFDGLPGAVSSQLVLFNTVFAYVVLVQMSNSHSCFDVEQSVRVAREWSATLTDTTLEVDVRTLMQQLGRLMFLLLIAYPLCIVTDEQRSYLNNAVHVLCQRVGLRFFAVVQICKSMMHMLRDELYLLRDDANMFVVQRQRFDLMFIAAMSVVEVRSRLSQDTSIGTIGAADMIWSDVMLPLLRTCIGIEADRSDDGFRLTVPAQYVQVINDPYSD